MDATTALLQFLRACGCDPVLCHACAQEVKVGDKLAGNKGYFVHKGACETAPITLPRDAETKRKLFREIKALGGLEEILKGGVSVSIKTKGPVLTFEEVVACQTNSAKE